MFLSYQLWYDNKELFFVLFEEKGIEKMKGIVSSVTMESKLLQHTFSLHVYTPPQYAEGHTCHVMITQDGLDYFQLGKIARKMDEAIEKGARPVIVVGVPYPSIKQRRIWYAPDSDEHIRYMRFLKEELLPFIEQKYNTWQLPHARTLVGDSLAGTISFLTALLYPNTFHRVIMQSPYVDEHILERVRQTDVWHEFELYHTIGTKETAVKTSSGEEMDFITPNRTLHSLLKEGKARYKYREFSGTHHWKYWEKDLYYALQFMFDF